MLSKEFIDERKEELKEHLSDIEKELDEVGERTDDDHWRPKFVNWGPDAASENIDLNEEWVENAEEQASYEANIGILKNLLPERDKILAALRRIDEDNYGKCANCNKEIDEERLKVVPEAELCLECEE